MRVAVTGATGRMGGEVIRAAHERGIEVALAVNRDPRDQEVAGVVVEPAADLAALLVERNPDVLVDFTGPESSVEYATACAEAGVPVVVGTTGFDSTDEAALDEVGERVPVLRAANFARGVQALLRAVESAVADLPGYDVEVTETHHNRKRDAPSGTANTLLSTIEAVRGDDGSERVHGREGEAPRQAGEIGVHARRAGDIRGEHEVLLAGNDEVVKLRHRAESRRVFAEGALDAAVWLAGKPAGWYDFADVLEDGA